METPMPKVGRPKSLNVEESRAKRLERQQARLRDRGGIFRPSENRTNNLFDILCKATHRQSPQRARGRSRSASISPRKKAQLIKSPKKLDEQKNTDYHITPAKAKATASEAKKAGRQRSSKPQAGTTSKSTRAKGKRKQKTEAVNEDDETISSPKSPSSKPRARKNTTTTRKPRQTSKKTNKSKQILPMEEIAIKDAKSTAKKKKIVQGSETARTFTSPSKSKRGLPTEVKTTSESNPPEDPDVGGNQAEGLQADSLPAKARSKKAKVIELQPSHELTTITSKGISPDVTVSEQQSRKRSSDELEPDLLNDNKRPRKKTKSNSGTSGNSVAAPNAEGLLARDNMVSSQSAEAAKRASSEGTKRPKKRVRKQAEIGDETHPPQIAPKRLKTEADGAHESKTLLEKTLFKSDNPAGVKVSSKKTKSSPKQDDREAKQRPRTTSRKRKENAMPKIRVNDSKGVKKSSGMPKQIKLRLKASMQHDDYDDGEPDPIDFLS